MLERLAKALILGLLRRAGGRRSFQEIVSHDKPAKMWARRYTPFWTDEWIATRNSHPDKHCFRPPWWRPFNILLHWWRPEPGAFEEMHDHPRWSVTICLRGELVERTPWRERHLKAGSIVIRSRKYIHSFSFPEGACGRTWTLFIVGRRNHRQNRFIIIPSA